MVAPLRILFIALAVLFGIGLAAAGVLGLWDLLQAPTADGFAGPPPFTFASYAYTPIIAVIVLLGGLAALKRRWEAVALACWCLLGVAVLEVLYAIADLGWQALIAGSIPDAAGTALALFAILGLWLATTAKKSRGESDTGMSAPAVNQDLIRLRNTLIGLTVVSYLWRAVTIALNPGAAAAIAYLRGTTETYLVLSSVVGLGAGLLLVICIIASFKGIDRFLHGTLAFTAGLAFEGSLDALDLAFGIGVPLEMAYALQDAVAFAACAAALALSLRSQQRASPLTTA